jgi:hypothetical protein
MRFWLDLTSNSSEIAQKNIRALGWYSGSGDTDSGRDHDNQLTGTLRWLSKRNMVSEVVRQRIEALLKNRWDALRWDSSAEGKALLRFAADSVGVKNNSDRAVNHYLDRLEQALDNQE